MRMMREVKRGVEEVKGPEEVGKREEENRLRRGEGMRSSEA